MAKRGGPVHVAKIRTKGKGGKVYTSYLLRRSYREGGRVRHENLGNLSHLPEAAMEAVRRVLAGEVLVSAEDRFQVERSEAARAKAGSQKTEEGFTVNTLSDLLAELGTLCRDKVRIEPGEHTFTRLTKPTPLQERAFQLLGVRP